MQPGWVRSEIAGKSADVFDPPRALPFALLWLHDESGELPESLTVELQKHRLRCVAPHAGRSWWVNRIATEFDPELTPERFLLDAVLPWLGSTWNVGPRGVAVAGIGMGGQGAMRLAFRHPSRFPIVGSIAGTMDFHDRYGHGTPLDELYPSRENARQDTAILHIHGHDWPPHIWFACSPDDPRHRGNDRLHEKLSAIGVPHTCDLDTRGEPDHFLPAMFTFLLAALERESRRLM
jgi:S-formylglutathione hydrolase